jgi:hypothetical protein
VIFFVLERKQFKKTILSPKLLFFFKISKNSNIESFLVGDSIVLPYDKPLKDVLVFLDDEHLRMEIEIMNSL